MTVAYGPRGSVSQVNRVGGYVQQARGRDAQYFFLAYRVGVRHMAVSCFLCLVLAAHQGVHFPVGRKAQLSCPARRVRSQYFTRYDADFVGDNVECDHIFTYPRFRDRNLWYQRNAVVGVFRYCTVTCGVVPRDRRAARSEQVILFGSLVSTCFDQYPLFMWLFFIRVIVVMGDAQCGVSVPVMRTRWLMSFHGRFLEVNGTEVPWARSRLFYLS